MQMQDCIVFLPEEEFVYPPLSILLRYHEVDSLRKLFLKSRGKSTLFRKLCLRDYHPDKLFARGESINHSAFVEVEKAITLLLAHLGPHWPQFMKYIDAHASWPARRRAQAERCQQRTLAEEFQLQLGTSTLSQASDTDEAGDNPDGNESEEIVTDKDDHPDRPNAGSDSVSSIHPSSTSSNRPRRKAAIKARKGFRQTEENITITSGRNDEQDGASQHQFAKGKINKNRTKKATGETITRKKSSRPTPPSPSCGPKAQREFWLAHESALLERVRDYKDNALILNPYVTFVKKRKQWVLASREVAFLKKPRTARALNLFEDKGTDNFFILTITSKEDPAIIRWLIQELRIDVAKKYIDRLEEAIREQQNP